MKLFMRNFYDQPDKRQEIKDPMKYSVICVGCAGCRCVRGADLDYHAGGAPREPAAGRGKSLSPA